MEKFKKNVFLAPVLVLAVLCLGYLFITMYFGGWYGYEKWKYRRSTYGNKNEAIERNVFIRSLEYKSNIRLDTFNIYIEKGFKYGYHSSSDTRIISSDNKYPYQVSFAYRTGKNSVVYHVVNCSENDSLGQITLYLKKPYLKDTLIIGINKYNLNKWDSIGYVKVWDKRIDKK